MLQNRAPAERIFPHELQVKGAVCWGVGTGDRSWDAGPGRGCTAAPHTPQNFSIPESRAPQEGQEGVGGGVDTGAGTKGAGMGMGGTVTTGVPQFPQNFSEDWTGFLHDRQRFIGGGGVGDGKGGCGRRVRAGAGAAGACGAGWAPSSCDDPQFLQNFAFCATLFPHSGQKAITDHVQRR
jgi:hypothetical protein